MLRYTHLLRRKPTQRLFTQQNSFPKIYEIPPEKISGTTYKILPLRRIRRKVLKASLPCAAIRNRLPGHGISFNDQRRTIVSIASASKNMEAWLQHSRQRYLRKRSVRCPLRNQKNNGRKGLRTLHLRLSNNRTTAHAPARVHHHESKTVRYRREFLQTIQTGLLPDRHCDSERTRSIYTEVLRQVIRKDQSK